MFYKELVESADKVRFSSHVHWIAKIAKRKFPEQYKRFDFYKNNSYIHKTYKELIIEYSIVSSKGKKSSIIKSAKNFKEFNDEDFFGKKRKGRFSYYQYLEKYLKLYKIERKLTKTELASMGRYKIWARDRYPDEYCESDSEYLPKGIL